MGVQPLPQLQLQLQLQPRPANLDVRKRYKLDKKITEEESRKRSPEQEVEDEVCSQKKLAKGRLGWWRGIWRRRDGRSWSGGRGRKRSRRRWRRRRRGNSRCFLIIVTGASHSCRRDPAACGRAGTASSGYIRCSSSAIRMLSSFQSYGFSFQSYRFSFKTEQCLKRWFIGGLNGFFGARQLPAAQSSPTRQRSTKSTKTIVIDNRNRQQNLPSNDSYVEDSLPKPKGFHALFRPPAKQKLEWETRTDNNIREIASERRRNCFDGVSPRRVELGVAGRAVKDARVEGLRIDGGSWRSGGRGRR